MNIQRILNPDGICCLRFDRSGSAANIFDRETLEELAGHVEFLEETAEAKAVVLISAKPKIFIAGADLNAFTGAHDADALKDMVETGQRIFTRLSRLSIPSVAAIHGVCLGGGCEIALACDWRVASDDKATRIGLPETQLGILPAWGGSVRLPRLIGLPEALGIILPGRQVAAQKARKVGLVDEVVHVENLMPAAARLAARGKRREAKRRWHSRWPFSALVAAKVRRDVVAKSHGHYPAPLKALEVCTGALGKPIDQGLALERAGFLELAGGEVSRNLLQVFFLQERAKKLAAPGTGENAERRTPNTASPTQGFAGHGAEHRAPVGETAVRNPQSAIVRRAAVVGAGIMGSGIAQWIAGRGIPVVLKDVNPGALAKGLAAAERIFNEAVKRRSLTAVEARAGMDRITPVHQPVPLGNVDLVIEAAVEQLELKQKVFRELEPSVSPEAVLATNTSAISIEAIASGLDRPERVLGLHFFNPVHRMQLVEVVRSRQTSPQALATALQFVKTIGKLPVIVRDSPGFVVNRILLPYLVESLRLVAEGHSVKEIDRTMLNFGMPMGPLRLADEVGLDVARHVAVDLERRLPSAVPVPDLLEKIIAKGWLGKKSGKGFYVFDGKREMVNSEVRELIGTPNTERRTPNTESEMRDRMVLVMVNEAARCLDEGVADAPEDIDFAMIMGTGWAPFRGGPLRYADSRGIDPIVRQLETLSESVARYFKPCSRLVQMSVENTSFYPTFAEPTAGRAPQYTSRTQNKRLNRATMVAS